MKKILRIIRGYFFKIFLYGKDRYCPICNSYFKKFAPGGVQKRIDVQCPNCGSLERHRFVWLYFERNFLNQSVENHSLLHFAPEVSLSKLFKKHFTKYFTADFIKDEIDVQLDISILPIKSNSFDIVYCSHVLEHVENDMNALSDLYRILRNDGDLLIVLPIERENTYEDYSIKDAMEREKIFGQKDHVRIYGEDVVERIRAAGFKVSIIQANKYFSQKDLDLYRTGGTGDILYHCKK